MLGFLRVGWSPVQGLYDSNAFLVAQRSHLGGSATQLKLSTIANDAQIPVDVLSGEDIVIGAAIALALAFTASFLQGRRSQNDFVLWEKPPAGNITDYNGTDSRVFDGQAWKEISRPDNYVFYNRKANERAKRKNEDSGGSGVEKAWVVVALLLLFVPIFSVEFFFALSRQLICDVGNPISRPDWAEYLCSPVDLLGS